MRARQARKRRIRSRREIGEILGTGARWRCPEFRLVYRRSKDPFSRFAVLVSKRHGNAVARNRIKRLFREVFRLNEDDHRPAMDILFRPDYQRARRSRVADLSTRYEQWRNELEP